MLSGGCALNASDNGTFLVRFPFDAIHVPPAPADDGNALGAALLAWKEDHPDRPAPIGRSTPFLGSRVDARAVERSRPTAATR